MNNIQLLATITRDIELKFTQAGSAIASFGVAYNEKRKQLDGSYGDVAHFFDVTAFGKRAETVNQWFRKGSKILISGSLDYQSWTAQDGQKRSKVGIKLNDFDFIDKNENAKQAPQQRQAPQYEYQNAQGRPVPPPQRAMPEQPPMIEMDENSELPF